ncbi:transcriptional regulator [Halobacillus sp. Marseille-Q1614]|uniref:ArsR/SmtB family transcription factor n=1 Tax=Halobacillus sp. Marseille-Q1614 TaxID=2709134 RepID=UPI00156EB226|nr:ArsR family transcriptional regulator [Halobacillus sp. Marseille-Q1614]
MKKLPLTFENMLPINKALANPTRIQILKLLSEKPHNVNELSEKLNLPFSTTASHINKLEKVDLILTELVPGRGTQKVSAMNYDRIQIDLYNSEEKSTEHEVILEMDIGEYIDCHALPHCGIVSEIDYIGNQDDPRSFYERDRKKAQLLYFRDGYVEYRFPNRIPYGHEPKEIEFSVEICSEAPNHKLDWPSDITTWVNNRETGTWTSPGDFGGERGSLTPDWWRTNLTQYGLLKQWKITKEGSYIDNEQISSVKINDLQLDKLPYIAFRLGIKEEAVNKGGLNIFGPKFGNHEQGIVMKIKIE